MSVVGQVLINGVMIGSVYALVAAGLALIAGVMNITNFAHGDTMMVGMFLVYFLVTQLGGDPYIYMIVSVIGLFLFGLLEYKLVISKLVHATGESQLLGTYGIVILIQNLALLLFGPDYRVIDVPYKTSSIFLGDLVISVPRLITFLLCAITFLALVLFLKHHKLGKQIRAASINRQAAELMGINSRFVYAFAFALGTAVLGIAGTSMLPYLYVYPTVGHPYTLMCFVVITLGGNNISSTWWAGLLIGLIEAASSTWISSDLPTLFIFAVFLIVLMFKPEGLFGGKKS